uniref:Protoporphyrinogen oxidase n=1 Tax=Oryza sativa subsp. japonica TaxID=39947 RepID=Q9FW53_ORYSJ|nr:putative protoporphyrinogen oxidase [Oryza sativa Japonica Group]
MGGPHRWTSATRVTVRRWACPSAAVEETNATAHCGGRIAALEPSLILSMLDKRGRCSCDGEPDGNDYGSIRKKLQSRKSLFTRKSTDAQAKAGANLWRGGVSALEQAERWCLQASVAAAAGKRRLGRCVAGAGGSGDISGRGRSKGAGDAGGTAGERRRGVASFALSRRPHLPPLRPLPPLRRATSLGSSDECDGGGGGNQRRERRRHAPPSATSAVAAPSSACRARPLCPQPAALAFCSPAAVQRRYACRRAARLRSAHRARSVDSGLKDDLVFGDPNAPRFVLWEGKLRPVPSKPGDLPFFNLMSIPGKLRAGLGVLGIRPPPPSDPSATGGNIPVGRKDPLPEQEPVPEPAPISRRGRPRRPRGSGCGGLSGEISGRRQRGVAGLAVA